LIDLIVATTWSRLVTSVRRLKPSPELGRYSPFDALRCAYLGFGLRPAIRSRWTFRAWAVTLANAGFARRCAST
jgi:hypothetical protein